MKAEISRLAAVAAWTAALGALLMAVDRLVVGIPQPVGWLQAGELRELPAAAGQVMVPSYLPDTLEWPPRHVLYRLRDAPGIWLGLNARSDGEPALWIGVQAEPPLPQALAPLAACLDATSKRACKSGWLALSRDARDGRRLQVLTRLPAQEAGHVLASLTHLR